MPQGFLVSEAFNTSLHDERTVLQQAFSLLFWSETTRACMQL